MMQVDATSQLGLLIAHPHQGSSSAQHLMTLCFRWFVRQAHTGGCNVYDSHASHICTGSHTQPPLNAIAACVGYRSVP